jgi:hypothetical protein
MYKAKYVVFVLALIASSVITAVSAERPGDTCRYGFVWREAFRGDHVCVYIPRYAPKLRATMIKSMLVKNLAEEFTVPIHVATLMSGVKLQKMITCVSPRRRAHEQQMTTSTPGAGEPPL